jgi:hypothetical protein
MSTRTKEESIIYLFHHIHHDAGVHEVHHCGDKHLGVDFMINHCKCGLHRIDKQISSGDTIDEKLNQRKVLIKFTEKCPEGGWHIESGRPFFLKG